MVGGTGIDCRLPDMSLGAYPPDLPRTAIGDLLWRQRPILGRVPLSQQSRLTSLHAGVVERGLQVSPPPQGIIHILSHFLVLTSHIKRDGTD